MRGLLLAALLLQDSADEAKVVLGRLAEGMRTAKSLSGRFTQTRRSALLVEPITSSGRLAYRREPEALAFILTEPARTEVRFQKALYTVYRPADKQLERFEFEDDSVTSGLFAAFNPDVAKIGKFATLKLASRKDGVAAIVLDPVDEKARRLLKTMTLSIGEADGSLRAFAYTDADGDVVEFALSDVKIDADVAAETFDPKFPEDVKRLTHKVKAGK